MNKTRHVTFRCTQKQHDALKAEADEWEKSLSAHIVHQLTSKYDKQCIEELENLCKWIWQNSELKVLPLNPFGITGDRLLTHYNTGGFEMELLSLKKKDKP